MSMASDNEALVRAVQRWLGVTEDGWGGIGTMARFLERTGQAPGPVTVSSRFDTALAEILRHEGGYVDHPRDPGGATNRGVTLGTLSDWLGRSATKAEVKALTEADVAPIYRARYWNAVKGDDLPAGVDLMVFDLAVNSGPGRAARFLQQVVGAAADGVIGPATVAKVRAMPPLDVIEGLRAKREAFYRDLSTFSTFGKGWMRRLDDVTAKAKQMAS